MVHRVPYTVPCAVAAERQGLPLVQIVKLMEPLCILTHTTRHPTLQCTAARNGRHSSMMMHSGGSGSQTPVKMFRLSMLAPEFLQKLGSRNTSGTVWCLWLPNSTSSHPLWLSLAGMASKFQNSDRKAHCNT